ncbi:serine/threonine-protein kinase DCLK3 [Pangasianodon hypophthalmus]|uniref:serine/threonine-protein kinase DCLK3 n=1 Tax=Pangasianodon hypophthalmus TaxID=310915 RepID=UPI002307E214|nr:serine/threonine-protein kinase DCLK3 [Pangasianodon hypophthalmus]
MWSRNLVQEAARPKWKVADQRTKLPACPNPRQGLPSYTFGSKTLRCPAAHRPLEKVGIGPCRWEEPVLRRASGYHGRHEEASPVRPRIVTVVRPCGEHNLRKISLLLNRRAVQTFELLMTDISEALGFPCWHSGRVRRLFSPPGQEIHSLSEFFHFGNAFLAFGISRPSISEVQAALQELYPDNPGYHDSLLRLWERILRPKAAKTDSGFHEDVPQHDSTLNVSLDLVTNQPPANHLQPFRAQVRQKDRGRWERQRGEWDNREDRRAHQSQTKEERRIDRKKEPVYCQSCRGAGPPIPPIVNKKSAKLEKPNNESKAPLSQDNRMKNSSQIKKTEADDQKNDPSILENKVLILGPQAEIPVEQDKPKTEMVEQKVLWEELPPDGMQVSLEEIQCCYDIGDVVGDGNFAVVYECRVHGCTQTFAMKMVDKAKLQGRGHMIQNEIALLRSLTHPRLVRLLRSHHTDTHVYLLMELVSGGDLFDAIARCGKFSEPCAARMIRDISQALEYIHNKSIAHRDIKPENLLDQRHSNGSINLKLADFGLAMVVTEPVFTVCGTPTYVAPEILAETGYGVEVDVWAMGVILFVLLSGFPPFRSPERNQEELFHLIQKGEVHFLSPYWDHVSEGAKVLISALLEVNPTVRLTASQTLQNSWLLHAAAQSDQEEATDTSNIIINKKDTLKSGRRKHGAWGNQPKLDMSVEIAQVAQTEGNRESNTNKYRETNMDQKDKQTPKRPSQVREISKNDHQLEVSVLVQKAETPE